MVDNTAAIVPLAKEGQADFFDLYFDYVGTTEAPSMYHRWTAVSLIGAILGRNVWYPFGHGHIYPNQYILLTGTPAARKGTSIKIGKNLLEKIEYAHIAPNKAAKEAFWGWMAKKNLAEKEAKDMLSDVDEWSWGDENGTEETYAYVAHDEFLDFVGCGDTDFVTNLTNLWDNLPHFINPKTRGDDIYIPKPTVNILSGITPTGIADSFKSLALGGGFFSRMLFIYSTPSGRKITFPSRPDPNLEVTLISRLKEIQQLEGELEITPKAANLLDTIYKSCPGMADYRFQYYVERRLTHLLKLIIVLSASKLSLTPTEEDIIRANTILYNAEICMPKALGGYGKSRYSDEANTIVNFLNDANEPKKVKQIYKVVAENINKYSEFIDLMNSLIEQDKIQKTSKAGKEALYVPNNTIERKWPKGLVDFTLLREDEHRQLT